MSSMLAQIRRRPGRKTVLLGVFMAIYFLLSLLAMGRFVIGSSLGDTWRGALLESMVSGHAEKPYVYRALVPRLIGAAVYLTPQEAVSYMNEALAGPMVAWRDHPVMRPWISSKPLLRQAFEIKDQYYLRLVACVVVAECLLLYVAAVFFLARRQFPNDEAMVWFSPVVGLLGAVALATPVLYVYDFAVLALSACCFLAMAARSWRWYYVAFALAFLNRESAAFIFVLFLLSQRAGMPNSALVKHALAQLSIMAAIKTALFAAYAGNPGSFLKADYFYDHMQVFLRAFDYKELVTYLMTVFLLVFRWREKPRLAKLGLPVFALMYGAFILFGNPREYRVFYDVLPLLALLATHTLLSASGVGRSRLFESRLFKDNA